MNIINKLDSIADKLINIVENLQLLVLKDDPYTKNIKEILSVALHYCHVVITIKDIAKKNDIAIYKDDIKQQLGLIEEFIDLTEDIS